jgi:fatty-acyl-CoA synthase
MAQSNTDPASGDNRLLEAYLPADTSVLVRELTIGDLLREAAQASPHVIALVEGTDPDASTRRRWTYDELLNQSERVALSLVARFSPGERLAVLGANAPEWEIIQLGAALAGLVLVPLNTSYAAPEYAYILEQSCAAGIVLGAHDEANRHFMSVRERLTSLREVVSMRPESPLWLEQHTDVELPNVDPTSPALIQYTSGTTGVPKGVILTHRGVVSNAMVTAHRLGLGSGAAWLNPLPMYHVNGTVFFALGAMAEASTHILSKFNPALLLDLIESERVDFITGVPTLLIAMMDSEDLDRRDLSSLRLITTGGTTVPGELVRQIEDRFGVTLMVVYGLTEAGGIVATTSLDDPVDAKTHHVGIPLAHTDVRIVDPKAGHTAACGDVGEICIRGVSLTPGYFEMPDETAQLIDAHGWLHTGDLGTIDDTGRLQVTGRLKEVIIRGGENIYPREIEDTLIAHPDIAEVAVVGLPDEYYGETPCAVVRVAANSKAQPEVWEAWAEERISRRKVPTRWFIVDSMPLTASGKIQKFHLREQIQNSELEEPAP